MKKWLSILLVIALMGTSAFSGLAFAQEAEEIEALPLEIAAEPALDAGETGLTVDVDGQDEDSTLQPPAEEDTITETTVTPLDQGYVRVTASRAAVTDASGETLAWLSAGAAALADGSAEGKVKAIFDTARGVVTGYVDAEALTPVDGDALDALQNAIAQQASVTLYQDDLDRPLPLNEAEFPETPGETETGDKTGEDETGSEDNTGDNQTGNENNTGDNQTGSEDKTGDDQTGSENKTDDQTGNEDNTGDDQTGNENNTGDDQTGNENNTGDDQTGSEDKTGDDQTGSEDKTGDDQTGSENKTDDNTGNEDNTGDDQTGNDDNTGNGEAPAPVLEDIDLPAAISIGVKENYALTAALLPEGSEAVVTWRTANAKIVKINAQTGVITGVKAGSAYVYAAAESGDVRVEKACKVTVMTAPSKVTLNATSLKLAADGITAQLKVTLPKKTASAAIAYTSSNPAVATVDQSGLITTVSGGTATITVKTFNGKKATCKVTVAASASRVAFAQTDVRVAVGQTLSLPATAYAANGAATLATLTYALEGSCLQLNEATGVVTALEKGEATVMVTTHNGVAAETPCRVQVVEAPADIELSAAALRIGVKETYTGLSVSMTPPEGEEECAAVLTWRTSNAKIAKVNAATGAITGVKAGSAYIYVKTHNGIEKACKVTVAAAPKKIAFSPVAVTLSAGGMVYTPKVTLTSGSASGVITYTSSNPAVASVDASGVITTGSAGTAVITATTFNKKKGTLKVTVAGEPASVALSNSEIDIAVQQKGAIGVSALTAEGKATPASYTFSIDPLSPNPGCIALNATTGAIEGVEKGRCMVRVRAHNGVEAGEVCVINVVEAPAAIELSAATALIGVKEVYRGLSVSMTPPEGEARCAAVLTWRSANAKIAKVDAATGAITGVKAGTTTIYVKTHNGLEKACKVTVKKAPTKLTLTPATLKLSEGGQTYALKAAVPSGTASGAIAYTSSNSAVATVDENGVITTGAFGTAVITAKTFNGKSATCKLTVLEAPAQVTLTDSLTIAEGQKAKVTAQAIGASGAVTEANFRFTAVDGSGAVTVDETTGAVQGVRQGTAYIKVETHNGVTIHAENGVWTETVCAVTITEAPSSVQIAATSVTLGVGEKFDLEPVMLSPQGAAMAPDFTVTRSNANVAVNAQGLITASKAGTSVVTVTTYNGVTAKCTVTVKKKPTKVTLSPAKPALGVGQTGQMRATFGSGEGGSVTFASSNPAVATIDQDGWVTALALGTTVITAKAYSGKSASVTLTVKRASDFLVLNADYKLVYNPSTYTYETIYTKTLAPGATFQLLCESEYETLSNAQSYRSANPDVATVSDKGLITAVEPGTTTIVVTATGGSETRCQVTVSGAKAAKLSYAASETTARVGQVLRLPALKGENISDAALLAAKVTVSDASVIQLVRDSDDDTLWAVKALKAGTAVVTAMAGGGQAQTTIQVLDVPDAPAEIHFEKAKLTMAEGETFLPKVFDEYEIAVDAELTSGNDAVVTVSESGLLTAVGGGEAKITAAWGELNATMTVKVLNPAQRITLNAEALALTAGEKFQLSATVQDGASAAIEYDTSNAAVATVSASGLIIARKAGIAAITATAYGGAEAVVQVRVNAAPTKLVLQPASIEAALSEGSAQIEWFFGASDEAGSVTFASDDTGVAKVSQSGKVTFVKVGQTTITARTSNGLMAQVDVVILPDVPVGAATYRLFTAASFARPGFTGSGALPFPEHNAKTVNKVIGGSKVAGQKYTANSPLINPSKTALLSGMASFFKDSKENDVSVVYLCSHGHMTGNYTGYRMSLPGYAGTSSSANYYLTSSEIFTAVSRINGKVVLIIDSCYSGTFIQDMKSSLDAEGGRISVLTAASNTSATYYNVTNTNASVDFFTHFLLEGLGYNERDNNALGFTPADADGDGEVTLQELFNYTSSSVTTYVPTYTKYSWFWGNKAQAPRLYAGSNKNLVIFKGN